MRTTYKFGLVGATGKLGSEVETALKEKGGELVLSYNRLGEKKTDTPSIIIDCSLPDVLFKSVSYVKKFNVPLIVATTGLTEKQIEILQELGKQVPVIQSNNFSVGIQLLFKIVASVKEIVPDWEISIEEIHHQFKKDKPSGTALLIKKSLKDDRIPIKSHRIGSAVGEHIVKFKGYGEVIQFHHSALSRKIFAQGISNAVEFAFQKEKGFFSFSEVIYENHNYEI